MGDGVSDSLQPDILLVDDHASSRIAIRAALATLDATVTEAGSGSEALDALLSHQVDVAILDVRMPDMNGFELAELMRKSPRTRSIPILFVTGAEEPGRVFQGYEVGAVDYLSKPVDPLVLRSKVAVFLELSTSRRQLAARVADLEAALEAERRSRGALQQAEALAKQRLAELEALYETSPIGLCVFDENLRWVRVNQRIAETNGKPAEEHIGKTPSELVPDVGAQAEEALRTILRTGERLDFEMTGTTAAQPGVQRAWSEHWVPIKDASGRVIGISVAAEEITEKRQSEERLRIAMEEAQRASAQLLEADRRKNEFLAVLSHELRNPLAPIRNSVYILERAIPGGEQAKRAREVIDRQAQHMTRLIEDLLDVTRISRGKITLQRERVDLCALARGTAEDHRDVYARNAVALRVEVPDEPLWIHGDPTRLAQAIGNLLTNSAKFTSRGGETILTVAASTPHEATVRVKDNGAGMSAETLQHLFEPFVQAAQTIDRTRGGLGLGLALVKGFVEMHGGTVAARSDGEGQGAELTITLPLLVPVRPTLSVVPAPSAGTPAGRRVLIIEDNVDAADSLKEALELGGHEIAVAFSGPEGVEAARRVKPDVVLCDIGLPGLDGYGVARALRADADPDVRSSLLIALSGYALQEDVATSKEAGFDRHVAKPPSLTVLEKLLAEGPGPQDRLPRRRAR